MCNIVLYIFKTPQLKVLFDSVLHPSADVVLCQVFEKFDLSTYFVFTDGQHLYQFPLFPKIRSIFEKIVNGA